MLGNIAIFDDRGPAYAHAHKRASVVGVRQIYIAIVIMRSAFIPSGQQQRELVYSIINGSSSHLAKLVPSTLIPNKISIF